MTRRNAILSLLLFLILLLMVVKLYEGASLGVLNNQYATLQYQLLQLQHDNIVLEQQLLQQESLITIEQKARQQGFTEATILFLP